jgi:hypothetical protein
MKINGLTTKQIDMLNIMWNFQDACEFSLWKESLNSSDYEQTIVLEELLIVTYIDEIVTDDNLEEARQVLNNLK